MTTPPSPEPRKWLWLHGEDNVAVALYDFSKGDVVQLADAEIALKDAIEYGHKFAVRSVREGEPVVKFAETIGVANRDISAGEHVHVHNVKSLRARKK